jgi:hypothetical protein
MSRSNKTETKTFWRRSWARSDARKTGEILFETFEERLFPGNLIRIIPPNFGVRRHLRGRRGFRIGISDDDIHWVLSRRETLNSSSTLERRIQSLNFRHFRVCSSDGEEFEEEAGMEIRAGIPVGGDLAWLVKERKRKDAQKVLMTLDSDSELETTDGLGEDSETECAQRSPRRIQSDLRRAADSAVQRTTSIHRNPRDGNDQSRIDQIIHRSSIHRLTLKPEDEVMFCPMMITHQ